MTTKAEVREVRVNLRLQKSEFALLARAAAAAGMRIGTYARESLVAAAVMAGAARGKEAAQ